MTRFTRPECPEKLTKRVFRDVETEIPNKDVVQAARL